ncbi:hypothetical protein [Saccharobesus litoralis]|nr:hypothetical protein [Saccharobesus litoralis]
MPWASGTEHGKPKFYVGRLSGEATPPDINTIPDISTTQPI